MKKTMKISLLILTVSALSACSVKTSKSTNTNSTSTSGTNTSTTGGGTSTGGGSTTTGGISCDGVYHDGATRCYYKNIPTIQVMGATPSATANGTPYWSSANWTSSGSGISPNQFATDATFNVRVIPRFPSSGVAPSNPAVSGKSCSAFSPTSSTYKKLYVQVRLRAANATTGEVATLTANMDTASNVWHFSPPTSSQPLVLEIINVMADIRCNWSGGKSYCPYADIPLNSATTTAPTECVAFDLQYSTDETYDLPGSSAN